MARTGNRGTWTGADSFKDEWEASSDNFATSSVVASTLTLPDSIELANAGKKVRLKVTGTNTYGSTIAYSPVITIPAIVLPALVITPAATQFQIGTAATAAGALIGSIAGAYPGAVISLPSTETRFVLNSAKDKLLVGAQPLTVAGSISLSVFQTFAGASNSPQANTVNVVVTPGVAGAPANPLDSLTGARLVFGGSKLLTAFSGNPVTASTGAVQTVADQSGVAQDIVVAPGATAPIFRTTTDAGFSTANYFNGRPYLSFGGNNEQLTSNAAINIAGGNFILVMTMRRPSNQPQEWGAPVTLWSTTPMSDGNTQYVRPYFVPPQDGGGMQASSWFTNTNQFPCPLDQAFVFGMRVVNGKMVFRINDTTSAPTDVSPALTQNLILQLGRSTFPTGASGYLFAAAVQTSDGIVSDAVGDWDLLFAQFGKFLGLKTQADVDTAWSARQVTGTTEPSAPVVEPPPPVTLPSTQYDAYSRIWNPATKTKPMPPTTPVAGVVFAPTVPQPSGGNDIQGGRFTGPAGVTIPARMFFFATTFAPGLVAPTDNLDVFWGGSAKEAQMVVLKKHEDSNTVDHALIITSHPQIVNGATTDFMIRKGAAALTGSDVGTSLYSASTISGSVTYKKRKGIGNGGAETGVNAFFQMSPAGLLANATSSKVRYTGKLASERSFYINCGHALRILVDITSFKDGTEDYAFEILADQNRVAGVGAFGSYFVDINISQGGTPVIQRTDLRIFNSCGWGKFFHTALPATLNAGNNPPDTTVQYDAGELIRQGVVPPIDLSTGTYETTLAGYASAAGAGFRTPYNEAGLQLVNMGAQGGRPDIGIITEWAQVYFGTMDPRARQYVIAHGEAFRHCPASWYDAINKQPMNPWPEIGGWPGLWTDTYIPSNRGNDRNFNPPDTFQTDWDTGRTWDTAHQPSFNYPAYLITGRRQFADGLEREACTNLTGFYVDPRWRQIGGEWHDWCFMQGNQPREAGWTARSIAHGVRLLPDTSAVRPLLRRTMNWNFAYLLTQVAEWKSIQGETFGWLPYTSPYANSENFPYWDFKPWMFDHYIAGCYAAAMAGSENAKTFITTFAYNYAVQRCMHEDVLPINKAADYVFAVSSSHDIKNPLFTENTWAKLAPRGVIKPGAGFWVGGNYARCQMRSSVLMATLLNDGDARTVAQKHRSAAGQQGAYLALEDVRGGPLDWFREIAWT